MIEELKQRARSGDKLALQELRDRGFFGKKSVSRSYAVSRSQRRMWIVDRASGGGAAYNLPRALLIDGPLDPDRLCRAFEAIVTRHESLRTTFEGGAGADAELHQIVHATIEFQVAQIDLQQRPDPLAAARELAAIDAPLPFDLETGPLLRVSLLRTAAEQHVLVFNVHHSVCDGWSVDVIVRELMACYRGETLAPLKIQYKDFAAWQNERLASPAAQTDREYWDVKLAAPLPVLDLPTDRPRPIEPSWDGRTIVEDLGADVLRGLSTLGAAHGASLFTTITAVVKVLLLEFTGQQDIVVGSPVAGRHHADLESQVGMYANAIALRDRLSPHLPFTIALQRVRRTVEEAFEHQETPFDQLVTDLGIDRDASRSPIFDVMVGLLNTDRTALTLGELRISELEAGTGLAPHDLIFYFVEAGGTLHLSTQYKTGLFDETTIRRLSTRLRDLASRIIAHPAQTIAVLTADGFVAGETRVTDLSRLAAQIVRDAGVFDAVVLSDPDPGTQTLTAFVVPGDATPLDVVADRVRETLAHCDQPVVVVPASSIPLLGSGAVHVRALERIARELERENGDSGPSSLADDRPRLLHRWDLVPPETSRAGESQPAGAAVDVSEELIQESAALADGGPLDGFADAPSTLGGALLRAAAATADARVVFLKDDGGEVRRTYAELLDDARRILGGLGRRGCAAGNPVVLLLPVHHDVLPAFWGTVLGGMVPLIAAVPSDFSGSNRAVDHLAHIWQILQRPMIVTTRALRPLVLSLARAFDVDESRVAAIEDLRAGEPATALHEAQPEDVALYSLTSGSTGAPKCVMLAHRSILARARGTNRLCGHTQDDVALNWLPFDHIGSISDWHVRCVDLACTVVYASKEPTLGDPLTWLTLLDRYRATHSWAPNFAYALVTDALRTHTNAGARWDLSCVETLLTAGEAVTREAVEAFLDRLAPYGLRRTAIRPAFGMAEMGSGVTYGRAAQRQRDRAMRFHRIDRRSLTGRLVDAPVEASAAAYADLGPPIPGVSLRIVSDEGVALGERRIGRLQVRGAAIANGYYRDEAATRAAFQDDGWFDTGDFGFLAEGCLALTGRAKEGIIVSGANYSSAEIESVVESVDGVAVSFAAAAAVRGPGDVDEQLAVFIATKDGADWKRVVQEIREAVVERIGIAPDYLVPVSRRDIPKTAIGKIQRRQLVKRFEAGEFAGAVKRADFAIRGQRMLPDWFAKTSWHRCDARPDDALHGVVAIVAGHGGIGAELARRLDGQGIGCTLFGTDAVDFDAVAAAGTIVYLPGCRAFDAAAPMAGDEFAGLVELTHALARRSGDHRARLIVATHGGQIVDVDDDLGGDRPAWSGLVASLRHELPWLDARIVDLPAADPDTNALQCLAEVGDAGGDAIAAWRRGSRYVARLTRAAVVDEPAGEAPIVDRGLYLLAGGAGGVGVTVARFLRDHHRARLLIVGRRPEADVTSSLAAAGLVDEVVYAEADVCDEDALRLAIDSAERRFGARLAGVVQLAGIANERAVADESPESIAAVLRPKTLGTWTLAKLAEERCGANGVFIAFSSVNGFLGGARASAYSAANAYVDALTTRIRSRGVLRCWTIAWSMWDDIGMSRDFAFADVVRARGFHVMRTDAAMVSLGAALARVPSHLLAGVDPVNVHLAPQFAEPVRLLRTRTAGETGERVAPATDTERRLARIWEELLGVAGIGVHDHFIRLGGHSLKAMQLLARVHKEFGAGVTLQEIFSAPTIAAFARVLDAAAPGESTAIPSLPDALHYAVSHAQRRLWIIERMGIGLAAYNISSATAFEGDLDVASLCAALDAIVNRHESLRTTFAEVEGEPRQIVHPASGAALDVVDLRSTADPESAVAARVDADAAIPFDLEHGPLLRGVLYRLGERRFVFFLAMHHIVSDGWSIDVIVDELLATYHAMRAGAPLQPQPLRIQYRDFAAWQNRALDANDAGGHRDYWLQQMSGDLPILDLPADRLRPAVQSFRGGLVEFAIDRQSSALLNALARANEATPFTVWLAIVRTLLYRYTGATDAIVGTPVAGREHADLTAQVGFYVNMLPLRLEVSGGMRFDALLDRTRSVTAEALGHQIYPYDRLVEDLQTSRDMGRNPLFDVVVSVREKDRAPQAIEGLSVSPFPMTAGTSKFDLTFFFGEATDGAWSAAIEYSAELFSRERMQRMASHLATLTSSAVRGSHLALCDLTLLPPGERLEVTGRFASEASDYPRTRTVASVFEEQAALTPDNTAVVAGTTMLSYRELSARSNDLARSLHAHGVTQEEPVGVLLDPSASIPVALLGILKAGGAYLPIDPSYPPERVAFMLEDTGCRTIVSDASSIAVHASRYPQTRFIDLDGTSALVDGPAPPATIGSGTSLAYVMYTSGSTGRPKASLIEQRSILRLVRSTNFLQLGERDRVLLTGSLAFDASTFEIWGPLLNGGSVSFPPRHAILDAGTLEDLIRRDGITTMWLTSSLFNQMVNSDLALFGHLRHVITGGERLSVPHVNRVREAFPALTLINGYGPTENTTFTACHRITGPCSGDVPIGRPIANTTVYVLDGDLRAVPIGVPGEICTGGDGLARGYLNRPDLTAERFVPHPFLTGERVYRTGDLGRWLPDGTLEILGRRDEQVKIRGYRVEPGEIEAAIRVDSEVREAVVITRPTGAGTLELIAYVAGPADLDGTAIRERLRLSLPEYMVPAHIVRLDRLPLNASRKVDRAALPAPQDAAAPRQSPIALPRTVEEALLVELLGGVLGRSSIGIHDNYFELGGDSIQAIQLASRARAKGWTLQVRDLFEHPTVARLAPQLRRTQARASISVDREGPVNETAAQRWFFREHSGNLHHFNQSVLLRPQAPIDPVALGRALAALRDRHDALRLVFRRVGDGFSADVRPRGGDVWVEGIDLRGRADGVAEMVRRFDAMHAGFDLEQGPLFRAAIVDLDEGQRLWLAAHHLTVDGVSWRIILEQLAVAYGQAARGAAVDIGDASASFRDRVDEESRYGLSDSLDRESAYWDRVDAAIAARTEPIVTYGDADTVSLTLDADETAALVSSVHHAYGTDINDVLLTGLGLALEQWTGKTSTVVALEGHGREPLLDDLDLTRTVGWFTSIFPFALPGGTRDVRDRLRRTKDALRAVPRKGVGYGIRRHAVVHPATFHAPELSFNYLGRFDDDGDAAVFAFADESSGAAISPGLSRPNIWDIVSVISGGRLSLSILCPRARTGEGQRLLTHFREQLSAIVEHCAGRPAETTPADFTSPVLDLDGYDELLRSRGWSAAAVENICRPTPMQEGLILLALLDRESPAYHVQMAFTLSGALDRDRFAEAWRAVCRIHPVLRSAFAYEGLDRPLRIVLRDRMPSFDWTDLRGMASVAQDQTIRDARDRDLARGFDFERDPLMRFAVFRLAADRWHIVWSYHHALLDGWSLGIVYRDFARAYGAANASALPPAPDPASYVRWLEANDSAAALAWWSGYLADYEQTATVPQVSARRSPESDDRSHSVVLAPADTVRLTDTAARWGVTLATLLQAAWGVVLGRYNRTGDVVFGAIVSGRPAAVPDVERMVGAFINAVPVRVRAGVHTTLRDVAVTLQHDLIAAEPFHHVPLAEIQGATPLGRDLFTHLLVIENYPVERQMSEAGESSGLRIESVEAHDRTHYTFNVTVVPGDALTVELQYDANAHESSQIARTADHYLNVLRAFALDREQTLESLEMMSGAEQELALRAYQPVRREPVSHNVVDRLAAQIAHAPEREAVSFDGRAVTYRALGDRASRIAAALKTAGVQSGERVAVMLERSAAVPAALFGVLESGAAYVPLDPAYPESRIAFMLTDSGCRIAITNRGATDAASPFTGWRVAERDEDLEILIKPGAASSGNGHAPLTLDSPAYVIYTSGSTGQPKGVIVPHRALSNQIRWFIDEFGVGADDRFLQKAPISFDASVEEIYAPLLTGGCLVMPRADEHLDSDRLAQLVRRERITLLQLVPSQLALMQEDGWNPADTSLRCLFLGGEAVDPALLARIPAGRAFDVVNLYGPTETCDNAVTWRWDGRTQGPIPIGVPVGNTAAYVLDEMLRPTPPGIFGELCLAGDNLAIGYLNRPELTAERFVIPASLGTRVYRTGDLCRWTDEGVIEFAGRIDSQVKIRGHRVECGEVESQLRANPAVHDAAVIAHRASGATELVAFVIAAAGTGEPATAELRADLGSRLIEAMIPSRFVFLDRLPLSPTGKIDRRALASLASTLLSDASASAGVRPPRDGREATIAAIWAGVLGRASIDVTSNFFDAGGHSLKAMQVVSRIHRELGVRLSLRDLFEHPTVEELAQLTAGRVRTTHAAIETATVQEHYALSHAQRRLWLLHQIPGGEAAYNMPTAFSIEGVAVDIDALERAFAALVARHEALRTAFVVIDGEPRQRILPAAVIHLQRVDLRDVVDAGAAARRIAEQSARTAFDLTSPPLLRVTAIAMPGDTPRTVVVLTMHHIVGDGWSEEVLVREVSALYDAFRRGDTDPLAPMRIQYKDFSEWQNRKGFAAEEAWWLAALEGMPERLALPLDFSASDDREFRGSIEELTLSVETTAALRALAAGRGMTLSHAMLAMFMLTLYRLTGQDDVCVGMSVANRNHPDLERLIGFFVNLLPVRVRFTEDMDLDALFARVSRTVTDALDRQDYPFDLLVQRMNPHRAVTRQPLVNVVYAFQNYADVQMNVGRPGQESAPAVVDAPAEVRAFDFDVRTSKFDLTLFVTDEGDRLRLTLEYDTGLFRADSVQRHLALLSRFVGAAT